MNTIVVKLLVILVTGAGGLTKNQTAQMQAEVRERLRLEVGVDVQLRALQRRHDLYPNLKNLPANVQRFYSWKMWLIKKGLMKRGRLTYLVFPPMPHSDGKLYIGGLSDGICEFKRFYSFASGNAELKNQDGKPRFQHSCLIMAHELLHQLGAIHIDSSPNVMHLNALSFMPSEGSWWALPILEETKARVRVCLQKT